MPAIIPFSGPIRVLGEDFPTGALKAGFAEVERSGIDQSMVYRLLAYDQRTTTYSLCSIGHARGHDRRCAVVGLRRLLGSMRREGK